MIRIATSGIARIPNLEQFLAPEYEAYREGEAVVGWGRKHTALKAIAYARKHQLDYIALEDGFLRSVGLGVQKAPAVSLLVDPVGVYYDASCPSRIEQDVNVFEEWLTPQLESRALSAIQRIVEVDLSKYNANISCPPDWSGPQGGTAKGPYVLCIDQTLGDASVSMGLADEESFTRMLTDAVRENPQATVLIKTHPDVVAGFKKGYLSELVKKVEFPQGRSPVVLKDNFAPIGLMKHCQAVYVVTSQTGFEALMAGIPVYVYGTPFYAGWGLTIDRGVPFSRRRKDAPLSALFAAAYLRCARYVSPVTGRKISLEEAIDFLSDARRAESHNRAGVVAVGIRRWKKPHLEAFLGAPNMGGHVDFIDNFDDALERAKSRCVPLAVWASDMCEEMAEKAQMADVALWRTEDAFIRSVGLGSDYELPYSLVFDSQGIYFDPSHNSDISDLYRDLIQNPQKYVREIERATKLIPLLKEHAITKYNIDSPRIALPTVPRDRRVILVAGQVDGDASVRKGGGVIQSNRELLEAVRSANPHAFILYLEHPDVASGNRPGGIDHEELKTLADQSVSGVRVLDLLEVCDELHVLTSLSGFEALIRGVEVTTYGRPFYAGWGLTKDTLTFSDRGGKLSLEALVAGALILYPRYYDWDTHLFCRCEDVCERMIERRKPPIALWVRVVRAVRNTLKALHLYKNWMHKFSRKNRSQLPREGH